MSTQVWLLWPNGAPALQAFVMKYRCEAVANQYDHFVRLECQEQDVPALMTALQTEGLTEVTGATKHEAYIAAANYVAQRA